MTPGLQLGNLSNGGRVFDTFTWPGLFLHKNSISWSKFTNLSSLGHKHCSSLKKKKREKKLEFRHSTTLIISWKTFSALSAVLNPSYYRDDEGEDKMEESSSRLFRLADGITVIAAKVTVR